LDDEGWGRNGAECNFEGENKTVGGWENIKRLLGFSEGLFASYVIYSGLSDFFSNGCECL
jgi:hypothetical protein